MTIKTRKDARIWINGFTAQSLRKLEANPKRVAGIIGGSPTNAQVMRAQAEILALAKRLEDWNERAKEAELKDATQG